MWNFINVPPFSMIWASSSENLSSGFLKNRVQASLLSYTDWQENWISPVASLHMILSTKRVTKLLIRGPYDPMIWNLHFHWESLNKPLYLRCPSYLHEPIALSHVHICVVWAEQRQSHPITLFVYWHLSGVEHIKHGKMAFLAILKPLLCLI